MEAWDYLVVAGALFAVALASGWLGRVYMTAPVVCLGLGFAIDRMGFLPPAADQGLLRVVAEATLAVVLFADAAQTRFPALRRSAGWAARLLLLGMPLALVIGVAALAPLFPGWSLYQVGLLAALLVPTDAALGQSLFADEAVPQPIREALTVESGVNDGLALPAIIFLACASVGYEHSFTQESWLVFALHQVGYGMGAGLAAGVAGGLLLAPLGGRGPAAGVATLALVALAFFGAQASGGNGLVAVFAAGLAFSLVTTRVAPGREAARDRAHEFVERDGLLMTMISFVYVGAVLLPDALARFEPAWGAAIALSLLVVRPLAVAAAMAGTGTSARTRMALGWFGPRGLATALFAVFVLEEFMALGAGPDILAIATLAVAASAVLHGATSFVAAPLCGPVVDAAPRAPPAPR